MPKTLGTLLPITALHDQQHPEGLFSAGKEFVDWLVKSKQNVWQLLPLNQTYWKNSNLFDSPYTNYGIGLNPKYLENSNYKVPSDKEIGKFIKSNSYWLSDYGLFLALSEYYQTDLWTSWPKDIRHYQSKAVQKFKVRFKDRVLYYKRQQAILHVKYAELKKYANQNSIKLYGDLPFYCPINSPIVWQFQDLFQLDTEKEMEYFSGILPGKFFGRQAWGHPLYNWEKPLNRHLALWKMRLGHAGMLYDTVRIDHAVGFYLTGKLHATNPQKDMWMLGPGDQLLTDIFKYSKLKKIKLIVEDLSSHDMGYLHEVIKKYNVPGISIFTLCVPNDYAFFDHNLFSHLNFNSHHIYYSSVHDSPPLVSFFLQINRQQKKVISNVLDLDLTVGSSRELAMKTRKHLYKKCNHLIMPMQDWLLEEQRVNLPGTMSKDNWSYQIKSKISDLSIHFDL